MRAMRLCLLLGLLCWGGWSCGYRYYAGPLQPRDTQAEAMEVADDGTVTFTQDRFEVRLRPMAEDELNRLFAARSQSGPASTNPYTYGDTKFRGVDEGKQRFAVFQLGVKNYAYPKVRIDPARILLRAANGREYWSLSFQQLDGYFRPYAIGYQGNEYSRYQERRDLLRQTMFTDADIFSGQEAEGFVVFPSLHPDVGLIDVEVQDVIMRFDFRNEPVETQDLVYRFTRDIGRIYRDGRLVLREQPE
ncbi:MAG: hypothetical protein AB1505_07425 [Candidatus Latescibacterota bacterium]